MQTTHASYKSGVKMNRYLFLLLVGAWLSIALDFDIEDFRDPVSPTSHLALSPDDDGLGLLEAQAEPEAAFDFLSDAKMLADSDSGVFLSSNGVFDDMGVNMDMWEESDEEDGDLLARQTRRCPPATYLCPNGRCCRTGLTCVGSVCCPGGKTAQCGTRGCYNPGTGEVCCGGTGRYCPRGYDCVSGGCCPRGTKPCGSGCYDPKTQVCCGGSGNTCPASATCVPGGCCPKGMKKCGDGCYDPKTQICCGQSGTTCPVSATCVPGGKCCPKGMKQCGNTKCYDPATQSCCPANSGLCSRQSGGGSCALDTVCPKDMTCVDGNQCCPEGHQRCGKKGCYNPETEKCCSDTGETCPKDYDCNKGSGDCCPQGMIKCGRDKCYDPKTSICCQDAVQSKNWACTRGLQCCVASEGCFDAKTQRCCADPSGPCDIDGACCAGKCCAKGYMCDKNKKCRKRSDPRPKTTKTCKKPTPARTPPTPMVTIPFVYDPRRRLHQSADPSSNEVFEISNRAVLMNMCQGMKNLNGGKPRSKPN
ncbi:uncharacterized protein BJX67DRAFT_199509 [Aspergillus lucknowensis]|uniref:Uncharacterized protein n=1 Tax=Aspergillus lucknowensis TaxID=176173 RepID=A0ABR4LK19_9EURO